jgi:dethiobiotin synthetase
MTRRIYVVGTDTGVGKTELVCTILRDARRRGTQVTPFKPAASGLTELDSDPARLLAAAELPAADLPLVCPLQYGTPLAPGLAHEPHHFLPPLLPCDPNPLNRVEHALLSLERRYQPRVVLIEGAGGLHVPMPGGEWQPAWIQRLAHAVLLVGRNALGTINHTILTITSLRALGHEPLGFVLVTTTSDVDPSSEDNAAVVSRATSCPLLAALPHRTALAPFFPLPDSLWRALAP